MKVRYKNPNVLGLGSPGSFIPSGEVTYTHARTGVYRRTYTKQGPHIAGPSPPSPSWLDTLPITSINRRIHATEWLDPYNNIWHPFPITGGYRSEIATQAAFYTRNDVAVLYPSFARGFTLLVGNNGELEPLEFYTALVCANSAATTFNVNPGYFSLLLPMTDNDMANVNTGQYGKLIRPCGSIPNTFNCQITSITWLLLRG